MLEMVCTVFGVVACVLLDGDMWRSGGVDVYCYCLEDKFVDAVPGVCGFYALVIYPSVRFRNDSATVLVPSNTTSVPTQPDKPSDRRPQLSRGGSKCDVFECEIFAGMQMRWGGCWAWGRREKLMWLASCYLLGRGKLGGCRVG